MKPDPDILQRSPDFFNLFHEAYSGSPSCAHKKAAEEKTFDRQFLLSY
jgi:hypothetical protein